MQRTNGSSHRQHWDFGKYFEQAASTQNDIPEPSIVSSFKSLGGVLLFKRPPSGHSGELAASKTIEFAVGSNCCQETEEIKDDSLPSTIFDTDGNKRLERVSGII